MKKATNKVLIAFGKNLKALRIAKGYSTRKFSAETGIANSYIERLESGLSSPTLTTLLKLAEVFEVDLNTLAGFK